VGDVLEFAEFIGAGLIGRLKKRIKGPGSINL
jgi:hypothetical protein